MTLHLQYLLPKEREKHIQLTSNLHMLNGYPLLGGKNKIKQTQKKSAEHCKIVHVKIKQMQVAYK